MKGLLNIGLRHTMWASLLESFFSKSRFHASDLKYDFMVM